jgi:hypothetical protein
MKTIEELGRKWKRKYPQDIQLSDIEAGRKCKEKHPLSYLEYIDPDAPQIRLELAPSPAAIQPFYWPELHSDLQTTIKSVQEYYDPGLGRLRSWNRKGKAEARVRLLEVLTDEQALLLDQAAMLEEAALRSEKNRLEFQRFVATHAVDLLELKSLATRIESALEEGLDYQSYTTLNKTRAENAIELDKVRGLSEIHLQEQMERTNIDLAKRQTELRQDLDAADRYELTPHELITKLTIHLEQLYRDRRKCELEETDDYVRGKLLGRHDKNISVLEQLIDARQAGLLLSHKDESHVPEVDDEAAKEE